MIIVLLLFFQSICLYCQRLVLYVYDRWINPKNVRLLSEAAELTGNRKLLQQPIYTEAKRNRKRYTTSASGSNVSTDSCNFCANTPKGYCRHHLYLQELEIQKQQQRSWNPLSTERPSEYRQWRKANRELKRNLKNRFLSQQQQQQQREQEQTQQQLRRQTRLHQEQQHTVQVTSDTIYTNETSRISISASLTSSSNSIIAGGGNVSGSDGGSTIGTFSNNSFSMYVDSAYQSNISRDTTLTLTPPTSGTPSSGVESVETIYYFEPLLPTTSSASGSSSSSLSSGVSYVGSFAAPVSISTSY